MLSTIALQTQVTAIHQGLSLERLFFRGCGNVKKELKLSEREYVCENCGLIIDRDLNAAINLRNKSVSYTESACGVPKQLDTLVSGGAMNQEVNNNVQHCVSFT